MTNQLVRDWVQQATPAQLMCRVRHHHDINPFDPGFRSWRETEDERVAFMVVRCKNNCGVFRKYEVDVLTDKILSSKLDYTDPTYLIKGAGRLTSDDRDDLARPLIRQIREQERGRRSVKD